METYRKIMYLILRSSDKFHLESQEIHCQGLRFLVEEGKVTPKYYTLEVLGMEALCKIINALFSIYSQFDILNILH